MSEAVIETRKHEVTKAMPTVKGAAENVSASDLPTPRILLMQGQSELVMADKARPGQYIDSLEHRVVGSKQKPLEMLIFDMNKTWVIKDRDPSKPANARPDYVRTEQWTAENSNLPWEQEMPNGHTLLRVLTWNYYGLIVDEDVLSNTPVVISFRSTSAPCAKKLNLFAQRHARRSEPSWFSVITLTAEMTTNEKGTFAVADAGVSRPSTEDEREIAEYWYDSVRAGKAKLIVEEGDGEHQLGEEIV